MSDAQIAAIGRNLAEALAKCAYERDSDSAKAVLQLQTELCAAVRNELQQGEANDSHAT